MQLFAGTTITTRVTPKKFPMPTKKRGEDQYDDLGGRMEKGVGKQY